MTSDADRFEREQVAFLERHNGADLLVCDTRTKQCTEAIYYSPKKKEQDMRDAHDARTRSFFQLVREQMELEDGQL